MERIPQGLKPAFSLVVGQFEVVLDEIPFGKLRADSKTGSLAFPVVTFQNSYLEEAAGSHVSQKTRDMGHPTLIARRFYPSTI